jgi:hypothetical protein
MIRTLLFLSLCASLAGCAGFQLPPIKVKACYVDDDGNHVCLAHGKDGVELSSEYGPKREPDLK